MKKERSSNPTRVKPVTYTIVPAVTLLIRLGVWVLGVWGMTLGAERIKLGVLVLG